jgi:hypothetical protein
MKKLLGFLKSLFGSNAKALDVINKVESFEKKVESVLPNSVNSQITDAVTQGKPKKVVKKVKGGVTEVKAKRTKKTK